ncbi:MAG TPA: VOC family protein, partial [Candidatus Sumerlaeota bacterium]|nr:VOC family protein [Candidatus Sumerlaeota bacterium]
MPRIRQKITPFLWFDNQAEEAARFYTSIFADSRIIDVARYTAANPDRVQQMLLQHSVQTEAFGGEVPSVNVSAKSRVGLDELLETL